MHLFDWRRIGAAALLTAAALAASPSRAEAPTLQDPADRSALQTLRGVFVSPEPEAWYGGYGRREFVFRDGRWSLVFTHALDPDMTIRTFQFRTGGDYRVLEASTVVDGAFDAVFDEDWKHVTLLTDDVDLIAALGMADCALTPNLEVDISADGCAGWRPVSECGQDHDLLAMDARGVYFGVRNADNDHCTSERRPTALLSPVVRY